MTKEKNVELLKQELVDDFIPTLGITGGVVLTLVAPMWLCAAMLLVISAASIVNAYWKYHRRKKQPTPFVVEKVNDRHTITVSSGMSIIQQGDVISMYDSKGKPR